jgi:hypothetical protein
MINISSQNIYCKSITYKAPLKNTLPFSWKITLNGPTFAVQFKKQAAGIAVAAKQRTNE